MKMMNTLSSFVCPCCKNWQTVNVKTAEHALSLEGDDQKTKVINAGESYMICIWHRCRQIYTGIALQEILDKHDTLKLATHGN